MSATVVLQKDAGRRFLGVGAQVMRDVGDQHDLLRNILGTEN